MAARSSYERIRTVAPFSAKAIVGDDSPSIDAFARWRVSEPFTIFDSKQIHDNAPLFFDDAETSGSGTGSVHSTDEASTKISVSNATAGTRVRQTFQRFNYQPGKSQQIFLTWGELDTVSGNTKRVGLFDGNNGIFFQSSDGVISVVIRSSVTGSPVDTVVSQSDWNLDPLDKTGRSSIELGFSKTQIGLIDFEWLGVGRVRIGFVVNGIPVYCHEFLNANNLTTVYMSTPNLPIRYEISNDGTGPADEFAHICCSVQSEGGQESNGVLRHVSSVAISGLATGVTYAIIGLRLQAAKIDAAVLLESISLIATTGNDKARWGLKFNPTVSGSFTYSDESNSTVQTATGSVTNTVTGGTDMDGGYFESGLPASEVTPNALRLGSSIAGVRDEIVLTCTPITNNITVEGSQTWRELS